jgi:hypothetical protein
MEKLFKFSFLCAASVFLIFSPLEILYPQVTQEWAKRYNWPDNWNDNAKSIGVDSLNNIYIAGGILSNLQSNNIATLKYNPSGVQQWAAIYNGPSNNSIDFVEDMAVDKSGTVCLAGSTMSGSLGGSAFLTIKYNTIGVQQWVKYYNGPTNGGDAAVRIAVDKNRNVYVVGTSPEIPSGKSIVTIKYNSQGQQIWLDRFNIMGLFGNYSLYGGSIAVDDSGYVYVGGGGNENHWLAKPDLFTLKYDSNGTLQWAKRYGSFDTSEFYKKLTLDNSGNVYVTGDAYWFTSATQALITIKYNTNGVQVWARTYAPFMGHAYVPSALRTDNQSNVYITGSGYAGLNTAYDFMTVKYDSSGDLAWVKYYISNDTSYTGGGGGDIVLDDSTNVYVTGTISGQYAPSKYTTIKYDQYGNFKWVMNYPGVGKKIAIDQMRNIYVAGDNSDSTTGADYLTIKYSQIVGVHPISSNVPETFRLYQNYPNPFNSSTKIRFDIPFTGKRHDFDLQLVIYDVLGKEIVTLVNHENSSLKPGFYEVQWDASNFSSGIYFYKINTADFSETKKMILIK